MKTQNNAKHIIAALLSRHLTYMSSGRVNIIISHLDTMEIYGDVSLLFNLFESWSLYSIPLDFHTFLTMLQFLDSKVVTGEH